MRLVREAAGFQDVAFGGVRRGEDVALPEHGGANPPCVAALWAADRRRFWSFAVAFAPLFAGVIVLGRATWAGIVLGGTLWAGTAAFAGAGLAVATRPTLAANAAWWTALAGAVAVVGTLAVTLP